MFISLQLFTWFALAICLAAQFSPDRSDYNRYGSKVAANNLMIVQADNQYFAFYIQLGNFTNNLAENNNRLYYVEYSQLLDPNYSSDSYYIYTVAVGKSPSASPNIFFVGAVTDSINNTVPPNPLFVGVLIIDISFDANGTLSMRFFYRITFLEYNQRDHLVLITDPLGKVAYGFSDTFTFSYIASTNNLAVYPENSLSPSTLFLPFAADYDGNRGILVGLLYKEINRRAAYMVTVILFSIDASTAIATQIGNWTYPSNSSAWQASLTFPGADTYNSGYDMSVSINPTANQVLVGIQAMNSVFFFSYTNNTLTFVTSVSSGVGLGFGKGVAWLGDTPSNIAILVNDYSTTSGSSSSTIYIYDSPLTNTSTSVFVFPNNQQLFYSYLSSLLINIVTTPDHLILLDNLGSFFIILSAPIGYYSNTIGPSDQSFVAFSSQSQCIPGTYKNVSGIQPCRPCPKGTKNDGTNGTTSTCVDCAANTFCPLGSITDSITNDELSDVIQALAYPESPDVTGLDDILFFTLFTIGDTGRCVALSPIFWTLIVAAIIIIITTVMLIIKYRSRDRKEPKSYKVFRQALLRTDLIREGDMWPGGLATFCALVLCIACCVISAKYYTSYPIETAEPSTYTCDTSLRNAQFSTSLRPLSIPALDDLKEMIDLLDEQKPNLDVSFVNTISNCLVSDVATLDYQVGSTWRKVTPTPTCAASNYIVTYSVTLPFRLIILQYTLPYTSIIGGLRIGLNAPGKNKSSSIMLQDLSFSQTLNQSEHMLGQTVYVSLQLTKVINKTSPLVSGDKNVFSGIWTGSFIVNYYESFMTDNEYLNTPPQTSTILLLAITETPYYVLNEQSPIARLPEIIYHDFLFITMIIGMLVLLFVIIEVMIIPCVKILIAKCRSKKDSSRRSSTNDDHSESSSSHSKKSDQNRKVPKLATINDSAPHQGRPFTSIQSIDPYSDNDHQIITPTMINETRF